MGIRADRKEKGQEQKSVSLTIRITPSMMEGLREVSEETGVTYAKFIFDAITTALEKKDEKNVDLEGVLKRIEALEECVLQRDVA